MKDWVCLKCGQEVLAVERPSPIKWTDGHVCYFIEVKTKEKEKDNGMDETKRPSR